jgi:DNA helicase-2/ATP-dependent DNA helicase PcrA
MQVSTFHSLCYKILKQEVPKLPELDATGNKAMGLLKHVLGYQNLNWVDANLAEVQSFISNCKNELKEPKDIKEGPIQFKQAYELFEKFKKTKGFITFDDLLLMTYKLFMKDNSTLRRWQRTFKYVIVDEFQDTNTAQYELMRMLSLPENNLMVVGDDDQSIYSWRGAVPEYMLNFENEFGARVIRMEKNYRCPKFIGRIANPLIATNVKRLAKTLDTQKDDEGELQVLDSFDFEEEASEVLDYIRTLPEFENKKYNEISILYRTNVQSRAIEDVLIQAGVPYELVGGGNFYDRKEIKDILMYFYAALDIDYRSDEGFERIINIPFRYLGRSFMKDLNDYREKMKLSFDEALRDMPMSRNQERQVDGLIKVVDFIKRNKDMEPSNLIANVVHTIGYEDYIKRFEGEGDVESNRMANIKELIRASSKFKSITEFLQYIEKLKSKRKEKKGPKNKVILSTIHRAKGLEWENVILIGCNELILPHGKNNIDDGLEEERRLAYVAVTRTKKRLVISKVAVASVMGGPRDLSPSRFIGEMNIAAT